MRRNSGVNVCWGEAALLVNADWVIPEMPADFVWPAGNPSIGCNALRCGNCGEHLRNMPDWRLAYGVGGSAFAQLYELADWRTAAGVLALAGSRTYICRCTGLFVTFPRPLQEGPIALDDPAPAGWHCGGHPRLRLPAVLDGLALSADNFGPESVGALLRGEAPGTRPLWLGPQPAEWLLRLFYLLDDRSLAAGLVAVVADFLRPEREEVAAALGFFAGLPAAVAEAARRPLAQHFAVLPADFPERRAPFVPHPRVERLLRRVESRLASRQ